MKSLFLGVILTTFFFNLNLNAQALQGSSQTTVTSEKSFYQNLKLIGGFKSYNDSGRVRQLENSKDLHFKSKNELYLGTKHSSGWGIFGQAVETLKSYGDSKKNTFSPGDPSVTITHPVIYESGYTTISGQARQYFPATDNSVKNQVYQTAYYSILNTRLVGGFDLRNDLIPRYFSQPRYAKADTTFYTEDKTTVSKNLASWVRVGMSQWTQVENHFVTATGITTELIPFTDFVISKNLFFGPRVSLPVISKDVVYDGPTNVSTGNIQAQFYLQATL